MVNPVGLLDTTSFHDNNNITTRKHRIRNAVDFSERRANFCSNMPARIRMYTVVVVADVTIRVNDVRHVVAVVEVRRVYRK